MKKTLSIIITVAIIFCMIPFGTFSFTANAEDGLTEYTEGYYTYIVTDGKATIVYFDDDRFYSENYYSSRDLTLPTKLGGYTVTAIGNHAFSYSSITKLTIPETITIIGYCAFKSSSGLKTVTIPSSVKNTGEYAFSECYTLTDVVIKNGVETIGYGSFSWCNSLTNITLPNSITTIDSGAFISCKNLENISYPDSVTFVGFDTLTNTAFYNNTVNWEGDYLYNNKHLISVKTSFSGNATIKNGTKTIAGNAFAYCNNLTGVTIPNGVVSIGIQAFRGCSKLKSITIPNTVKHIDDLVFYECTSLKSIVIPNSVTHLGDGVFEYCYNLESATLSSNITKIGDNFFNCCRKLTAITIPSSVTNIGDFAFYYCESLTSIVIPDKVTSIGESALGSCKALKNVTIGKSVKYIGDWAFWGSNYIENLYIKDLAAWCNIEFVVANPNQPGSNPIGFIDNLYINGVLTTDIVIPEGTTQISERAFERCTCITSVSIPKSVKSIGENTFTECINLTNFTVNNNNNYYSSIDGVLFNKAKTDLIIYPAGKLATDYTVPNGVKTIKHYAFYKNKNILNLTIPDSVVEIKEWAFAQTNIGSVKIGNGVITIGERAFEQCTNLSNVTLGNKLNHIGSGAFSLCFKIKSIIIPDSVTSIGDAAFSSCNNLKDISISKNITSLGFSVFSNTSYYNNSANWHNDLLYIDAYLLAAKETVSGNCVIKDGTKVIADRTFDYLDDLTGLTIPASVLFISSDVVNGCYNFNSFTVDKNNKYYSSADGVLFNKNKTTLIKYPIAKKETTYVIPNTVMYVDDFAFEDCKTLTSVTIPKSVIEIGNHSFAYCNNIKDVYYGGSWPEHQQMVIDDFNNDPIFKATWHYANTDDVLIFSFDDVNKTATVVACAPFATKIIIPESVTKNSKTYVVTTIGESTFEDVDSIESVTIPTSITTISKLAFAYAFEFDIYYRGSEAQKDNIYIESFALYHAYPTWYYNSCIGTPNHTYDDNCDEVCNVCNYIREVEHSYTNACDTSCNLCGNIRNVPPHFYDNACDPNCNECGFTRSVPDHVYNNACDKDCNECGKTRNVPDHVYDNKDDKNCNVCGALRTTEWSISVSKTGVYNILPSSSINDFNKDTISVFDKNNNTVKYNENIKGWPLVKGLTYTVKLNIEYPTTNELNWNLIFITDTVFPDTHASGWYNDAVTYSVGAGIISGYSNGKFGTSDSIQRQDFLVMLARYEGINFDDYKGESKFPDVENGSYYEAAVNWGVKNGIVTGYDNGKFGVSDKVTREQLVTFLYRYAKYKGYDYSYTNDRETIVSAQYNDYINVSEFAVTPILWAIEKGVISGKSPTTIAPQGNAQRCEVAQIMFNIFLNDIFC